MAQRTRSTNTQKRATSGAAGSTSAQRAQAGQGRTRTTRQSTAQRQQAASSGAAARGSRTAAARAAKTQRMDSSVRQAVEVREPDTITNASRRGFEGPQIDGRSREDIAGIVIGVVGVALLVAVLTPTTGVLTKAVSDVLHAIFGLGAFLVPVALILAALSFFIPERSVVPVRLGVGMFLIALAVISLLGITTPGAADSPSILFNSYVLADRGGYIGNGLAWLLLQLTGQVVGIVLLVGVAVAGLVVIGFSMSEQLLNLRLRLRERRSLARRERQEMAAQASRNEQLAWMDQQYGYAASDATGMEPDMEGTAEDGRYVPTALFNPSRPLSSQMGPVGGSAQGRAISGTYSMPGYAAGAAPDYAQPVPRTFGCGTRPLSGSFSDMQPATTVLDPAAAAAGPQTQLLDGYGYPDADRASALDGAANGGEERPGAAAFEDALAGTAAGAAYAQQTTFIQPHDPETEPGQDPYPGLYARAPQVEAAVQHQGIDIPFDALGMSLDAQGRPVKSSRRALRRAASYERNWWEEGASDATDEEDNAGIADIPGIDVPGIIPGVPVPELAADAADATRAAAAEDAADGLRGPGAAVTAQGYGLFDGVQDSRLTGAQSGARNSMQDSATMDTGVQHAVPEYGIGASSHTVSCAVTDQADLQDQLPWDSADNSSTQTADSPAAADALDRLDNTDTPVFGLGGSSDRALQEFAGLAGAETGAGAGTAAGSGTGTAGQAQHSLHAGAAATMVTPPKKPSSAYRYPSPANLHHNPGGLQKTPEEQAEIREMADMLSRTLAEFKVPAEVVGWVEGPTCTTYEVQPGEGVRVNKFTSLEEDISRSLARESVRIYSPVHGTPYIGIEVPNTTRQAVYFGDVIPGVTGGALDVAVGLDAEGKQINVDLATLPHLLIAGTTGSGKSVMVNSIICSMLMRDTPDDVRMIMVDPKQVELTGYNGIPHLIMPVVSDPRQAASALQWGVTEMDRRYRVFSTIGVRNIATYNAEIDAQAKNNREFPLKHLPYVVIIIDELTDLMMVAKKDVEASIVRIAQLGRAAGIHLVLATQRPSADVVTGLIKANVGNRMGLKVATGIDSKVVLDQTGAEKLLGRGDMLFLQTKWGDKPRRIQGCYLSDPEIADIVDQLRMQNIESPDCGMAPLGSSDQLTLDGLMDGSSHTGTASGSFSDASGTMGGAAKANDDDPLAMRAAYLVVESQMGSTSMIQRRLKLGYARAGRVMDMLEEMGIVGPARGGKTRDVLVADLDELATLFGRDDFTEEDS